MEKERGIKGIFLKVLLFVTVLTMISVPSVSAERCEMPIAPEKAGTKLGIESSRKDYGNKIQELQKGCDFIGSYKASAYSPSAGGINSEGDPTATATSTGVKQGRTIAVDHLTIPYGSVIAVKVPSMPKYNGLYLADDTGGAIVYNRIDMMIEPYSEAMSFGRRDIDIHVLEYGTGAQDARDKAKKWDEYLEKYKEYAESGFEYGITETEIKEKTDKAEKESGYTKKDYYIYRKTVENYELGIKTGDIPVGSEQSNWFFVFSTGVQKWLFRIGWVLNFGLIGYVTLYMMMFLVAPVRYRMGMIKIGTINKMVDEVDRASVEGKKGIWMIIKRVVVALALMFVFATGVYIQIMSLILGVANKVLGIIF